MFCFWCEPGNLPKNLREKGFVWIHLDCLQELMDFKDDIKSVQKILKGEKNETIESFLKRMQDFDKKWTNITNQLKELGVL